MSFDYPHTCPEIDTGIKDAKSYSYDVLSDMLVDCCPLLEGKQKTEFINKWVDQLYQDLEPIFEGVRSTNQDMRSEAERQINVKQEGVENLEYDISEKDKRIEELEGEIDDLENQVTELEKE